MPRRTAGRPGEFELIERYFRPLATGPGAFDLLDDASLLSPVPGEDLVLTVDLVVAGVHFLADDPPRSIARKALAVNLSDLAGKGAEPVSYLLALALPEDWTEDWIAGFAAGLAEEQGRFGISLLGGDTSRAANGLTISITAIGSLPTGSMVHRSGARPGDIVFVSGTIGDGALGLGARLGTIAPQPAAPVLDFLLDRYLHPQPRVALAPVIRAHASSAMDVSDGLVGDLAHICRASGVGAAIEAAAIPLSDAARAVIAIDPAALATALTGGDDYELLATVPEAKTAAFAEAATRAGVPVAAIGRIVAGQAPPLVLDADGKPMRFGRASHTHF